MPCSKNMCGKAEATAGDDEQHDQEFDERYRGAWQDPRTPTWVDRVHLGSSGSGLMRRPEVNRNLSGTGVQ